MKRHRNLAALLVLGVLGCGGDSPVQEVTSDVEQCRENLLAIYDGLLELHADGGMPTESGVGLFAELVRSGTWDNTDERARLLTCPGSLRTPRGLETGPAESWFSGTVDGTSSGYAGRDLEAHPLPRFPTSGTEILMACDNAGGPNHEQLTNALFADGSIKTYDVEKLAASGMVAPGTTHVTVGPGSPIDAMSLLVAD